MQRLKANKTSLYKLVATFEKDLPPMRRTMFTKAPRSPSWWLEWSAGGLLCKAYFSAIMGRPMLSVTKKGDNIEVSYTVHDLDTGKLRDRGMVETFVTAAERKRAAMGGPGNGTA